jgi:flagellar biosynthesis/type III secretory pathway M-ring protein FliF/YscJ
MDIYSWIVLIVLFFIVVWFVYRGNKRLAQKEQEASKDINEQFEFLSEDDSEDDEEAEDDEDSEESGDEGTEEDK